MAEWSEDMPEERWFGPEADSMEEGDDRTAGDAGRATYHFDDEILDLLREASPMLEDDPSIAVFERDGDTVDHRLVRDAGGTMPPTIEDFVERTFDTESARVHSDDDGADDGSVAGVTSTAEFDGESGVAVGSQIVSNEFDGSEKAVRGVLVVYWPSLSSVSDSQSARVETLAGYLGTAITAETYRSNLESTRRDLARSTEMVEVYDTILRHDLGNDLQIVTGFSDAIQLMVEEEDVLEYIERIYETAEQSAELIGAASRTVKTLREGQHPTTRPLEPTLSRTVRRVERGYDSITVEYEPEAFDVEVFADDLLETVFEHVLTNAAIHTEGSVTVSITLEEPSRQHVEVLFIDDGSGLPEELGEAAFQMGTHGVSNDGPGFGLGLVRTVMDSYGGTASIREGHAGGTTVALFESST